MNITEAVICFFIIVFFTYILNCISISMDKINTERECCSCSVKL